MEEGFGGRGKSAALKRLWNLTALPFVLAFVLAALFLGGAAIHSFQVAIAPPGVFFCAPTQPAGIIGALLAVVAGALLGFAAFNLVKWLVLALWNILRGAKLTHGEIARFPAQFTMVCIASTAIIIPIEMAVNASAICLSSSQIHYRPMLFSTLRTYDLSQVTELRPSCWHSRGRHGEWNIGLDLVMRDGTVLDVGAGLDYGRYADRILSVLEGVPLDDSDIRYDCPERYRKRLPRSDALWPMSPMWPVEK